MAFVSIVDIVYPIGTAYMSTTSTSPAILFGGTWSEVKNALLSTVGYGGAMTVGNYGGSNIMTVEQMPAHEHSIRRWNRNTNRYEYTRYEQTDAGSGSRWFMLTGGESQYDTLMPFATETGGGNPSTHTIIPSIVGFEPLSLVFQGGDVAWHL